MLTRFRSYLNERIDAQKDAKLFRVCLKAYLGACIITGFIVFPIIAFILNLIPFLIENKKSFAEFLKSCVKMTSLTPALIIFGAPTFLLSILLFFSYCRTNQKVNRVILAGILVGFCYGSFFGLSSANTFFLLSTAGVFCGFLDAYFAIKFAREPV